MREYCDLLYIEQNGKDRLAEIDAIVKEVKNSFSIIDDLGELCRVVANNIVASFKENGINYRIINTAELDSSYEHIFIIAFFKTETFNYILIDPTYEQFVRKDTHKLRALEEWPSEVLQEDKRGRVMLDNLIRHGYHLIDDDMLSLYLKPFTGKEQNISLDDILLLDHKFISSVRDKK